MKRVGFLSAFSLCILAFSGSASAVGSAQDELEALLHTTARNRISSMRATCALGKAPALRAMILASGFETPNAAAWCVTVLTRAGRDGDLGFARDPSTNVVMPALAFDNGFVAGYRAHASLPEGAPPIDKLLPVADRCLGQREANRDLCNAVGQMLGTRAADGEVVKLP